jgi:ribosomal protein S18 acetylase RimI-like enzyme
VPSPTADVSVRLAWSADAAGIAAVQVRSWRQAYVDLLPPEVLDALDPADFAAAWTAALDKPRDARNRVLVALERVEITGFAATGPSGDPDADPVSDGQIVEIAVDPAVTGRGHGSRLLQACADTLRADRFTSATMWLNATDDALRRFVTESGWAPDGAHRELDLHGDGAVLVKQVRLHTDLRQE